jgi:erythromycin esterase
MSMSSAMEAARGEFVRWAKGAAIPVASDEDLAPLASVVRDARVVALGESWHSSAQLLALKNMLVRHLVQRHGFDVVAFEGGLPGTPVANAFVKDGRGTATQALLAFGQPMWLNAESVALLDWLRARNDSTRASQPVELLGVDPAYPGAAAGQVLAFMSRVDPGFVFTGRALLERVAREWLDVEVTSTTKSAVWGATAVYEKLDAAEQAELRGACAALASRLLRYRSAYAHASSRAELDWALRLVTVLEQAQSIAGIRGRSLTDANIARDLAFAENLMGYLESAPTRKVVVIAHNIHVAREPFFSAPGGAPIPSMGTYLAQWLGKQYVPIGSAVGRGGGVRGLAAVPASDPSKHAAANASNDAALEEVAVQQFVLDTRSAPEWAATPRLMRSHLEPQPHYSLRKSFDAIAYTDVAERSASLPLS